MLGKIYWLLFSAASVIASNPCVGPSPSIKIYFSLVSTCTEEFISTPKVITFLLNPQVGNENVLFV